MFYLFLINALIFAVLTYLQGRMAWDAAHPTGGELKVTIDHPDDSMRQRMIFGLGILTGLFALLTILNASFAMQLLLEAT